MTKAHEKQVGSLVVSRVTSYTATWVALVMLLSLHLSLNYSAVRSVQMTSLNRQRTNMVFSTLFDSDSDFDIQSLSGGPQKDEMNQGMDSDSTKWRILSPAEVARQERIFESDGILRWSSITSSSTRVGFCRIGISVQQFMASSSSYTSSKSLKTHLPISQLSSIFKDESYLLVLYNIDRTWYADILLKNTSDVQTQLKAWAHALLAGRVLSRSLNGPATVDIDSILMVIATTLKFLNASGRFDQYLLALTHAGWDVNLGALETKSGRRISED